MFIQFVNTDDDFRHVVEVTDAEWQQLTKRCREKKLPIDGATVDAELLDELLERPAVKTTVRAQHTIEMV